MDQLDLFTDERANDDEAPPAARKPTKTERLAEENLWVLSDIEEAMSEFATKEDAAKWMRFKGIKEPNWWNRENSGWFGKLYAYLTSPHVRKIIADNIGRLE